VNLALKFKKNTVDCFNVPPYGFFYYDFFQNYLCRFYFFNIELVENCNYNKAKSCGENTIDFLTKYYRLL